MFGSVWLYHGAAVWHHERDNLRLWHVCNLSHLPFMIHADKISSFSQGLELPLTSGWHLCCLLSFWQCQTTVYKLEQFATEYDKIGMRISTSNFKFMTLSLSKRWLFDSGSEESSCCNEGSGVLWIWVTSIARFAAVMWSLYCTLVVEGAKFKVLTLTYEHEIWVMSKGIMYMTT